MVNHQPNVGVDCPWLGSKWTTAYSAVPRVGKGSCQVVQSMPTWVGSPWAMAISLRRASKWAGMTGLSGVLRVCSWSQVTRNGSCGMLSRTRSRVPPHACRLQLSQIYYGILRWRTHACRLRLQRTAALSPGGGVGAHGASQSPPPSLLETEKGPVQAVDFRVGGISHPCPGQSPLQPVCTSIRMGHVALSSGEAMLLT